jgi:hypothetical protein
MAVGATGIDLTRIDLIAVWKQAVCAFTPIEPETNIPGKVRETELVPCPELIIDPAGADHSYEVAPTTNGQE